jgi:hypothetical protein
MAKLLLNKKEYGWWKSAVFYQIYPKSFQDTDGDGAEVLLANYAEPARELRPYEAVMLYYKEN